MQHVCQPAVLAFRSNTSSLPVCWVLSIIFLMKASLVVRACEFTDDEVSMRKAPCRYMLNFLMLGIQVSV